MQQIEQRIDETCARMEAWLRDLPEWTSHPRNPSGSVSSHFGPTILSEHDCVLHFARFLSDAGVSWRDMHLELSPGQWMFTPAPGAHPPKRIDLAIIERDRLQAAPLPSAIGDVRLDVVMEFALASNYWMFGSGSPRVARTKVEADVEKVGEYLRSGLARRGYVIVIEECDHLFPADFAEASARRLGVDVRLLRCWS